MADLYRRLAAILREARAVRRRRGDLVIAETRHGFVCASAGVDTSNAPGDGWVVLCDPAGNELAAWSDRSTADSELGGAGT